MQNLETTGFIGDDRSKINQNTEKLFTLYKNINDRFEKNIIPILQFYRTNKSYLNDIASNIDSNRSFWDTFKNLVNTQSDSWLKPITHFYSKIVNEPFTVVNIDQITQELINQYPVLINNIPVYVEKQKAIIYILVNKQNPPIATNDIVNSNPYTCRSSGAATTTINCGTQHTKNNLECAEGATSQVRVKGNWETRTIYTGTGVRCPSCDKNCTTSISVACNYPENGFSTSNRYISANITTRSTDIFETEIRTFVFEIKNCSWVYLNTL